MTKAFYSGFYPDGLGVGGTALGSASHRGIEDIIKNLDDISIQRLVEARSQLNLKLEDLEAAVDVTIPSRLQAAESLLGTTAGKLENLIDLYNPEAGTLGARFLTAEHNAEDAISRVEGMEAIIGTDDEELGTLRGRLATLESIDWGEGFVTVTQYNQLKSEVESARGGHSTLTAKFDDLTQTFVDGLGNKADAIRVTQLEARRTPLKNLVRKASILVGTLDTVNWGSAGYGGRLVGAGASSTIFRVELPLLKVNVKYSVSFRAKLTAGTSQVVSVELQPDTLPETTVTVTPEDKMYTWDGVISSHADITGQVLLRIYGNLPVGTTIEVTDVVVVEADIAPSGYIPAPEDTSASLSTVRSLIQNLQQTTVDLETQKADATEITNLQASIEALETSSGSKMMGGSPADYPMDFTRSLAGKPADALELNMTDVTVVNDPTEGPVLRITNAVKHIWTKEWYPIDEGRTYRVTARVRVVTDGTNPTRSIVGFRLTNADNLNGGGVTGGGIHTAAEGWKTYTFERTSAQLKASSANSTHFRIGAFLGTESTSVNASGATVEVAWYRLEDVTVEKAMQSQYQNLNQALVDGLAGKASTSSVTALESTIGGDITSLNNRMSATEADISGKASSTEVATLRSVVHVRPNLLINGGMELGLEGLTSSGAGTLKLGGDDTWGAYVWTNNPTAGNRHIEWPVFPVAGGYEYTISGDHMISGGGSCYFDIQFYNANWDLLLDGPNANALVGAHDFSNHPNRLQQTAITSLAPAGAVHGIARFVLSGVSASTICGARRVKVEMGPLPATIYTPEASMSETYAFAENTFAEFSQFQTATTDALAGKASATDFNSLRSEVTTARGSASSLANRLTTVESNINGKASATSVSNLEAELNNAGTGIKARLTVTESVAVTANNKAQSTYGVVADANGSIVGFQMSAGGNSSSFKIRADKFEIAGASSTGARTVYSNNSWKVYDNNNVLRVEMGVFT